jgi:hypothetical protein
MMTKVILWYFSAGYTFTSVFMVIGFIGADLFSLQLYFKTLYGIRDNFFIGVLGE